MNRPFRLTAAAVLLLPPLLVSVAAPAAADRLPSTYTLFGDPGGSQFEGIATAPDREHFYVSEVTGGEIHRGEADEQRTVVWIDQAAALRDRRAGRRRARDRQAGPAVRRRRGQPDRAGVAARRSGLLDLQPR